jgi:diaminopimelate epimerase
MPVVSPPLPANLPFTKMHGSGNDFLLIDHRTGAIPDGGLAAFVRGTCRRRLGIGADGVILIEHPQPAQPDVDFHWRYFNADGSVGELCGNGAMCGARFAWMQGIAPAKCRFSTMSGTVQAEVATGSDDPRVTVDLVDSSPIRQGIVIGDRSFDAVTIGVPHAVTVVDDADAFASPGDFHTFGRDIRNRSDCFPAGTNVNVIHRVNAHTIRMRTYERGVEAETLACGTGAAASAFLATVRGLVHTPVTVLTSSGKPISVTFAQTGTCATDIRITGEAIVVAHGQMVPGAWQ